MTDEKEIPAAEENATTAPSEPDQAETELSVDGEATSEGDAVPSPSTEEADTGTEEAADEVAEVVAQTGEPSVSTDADERVEPNEPEGSADEEAPAEPAVAEDTAPQTTDGAEVEPSADDAAPDQPSADASVEATKKSKAKAPPAAPPLLRPERPEIIQLREAQKASDTVEGKVIGWNNGGLHVVVDGVTAFCPRSEIELGAPRGLESYLDQTLPFKVLRVQKRGRRVVLSRRTILQADRDVKLTGLRDAIRSGQPLEGTVSSVTDFGAFVDVGEVDGLVHVSELSRGRVEHPSEMVSPGDSVKVRVLKVSDDGTRVSLSMKALEPDPWDGIEDRFPAGNVVTGTVERVANFGAFVEIAPGLTGLLPTSAMNLPRNAQPARLYHPGKEISVQILSVDRRRRRISLALEGSQVEGTRADLKSFQDKQRSSGDGFGSLAAAFNKARKKD